MPESTFLQDPVQGRFARTAAYSLEGRRSSNHARLRSLTLLGEQPCPAAKHWE